MSIFLQELNCSCNQINYLSEQFYVASGKLSNLLHLDISFNLITELPEKLPKLLNFFNCSLNKLMKLPNKLPDSLKIIYCTNCEIIILPKLPNSLQELYCSGNNGTAESIQHVPLDALICMKAFLYLLRWLDW